MKTDKPLYAIFSANPQWIFELTGLESPGECEFQAVTLKALEQQSDGVLFPKDPTKELTVVEFQFQEDPTIYIRTVIEMALLQRENLTREVQGIIFFRYPYLDPKTQPWCRLIRSYLLRDVLESLAQREPTHPLVPVFQPVLLTNEETLEKHAAEYYNQIKTSDLADSVKATLLDVFVQWLEQCFKDKGKKEIENMLTGELTDLRETQSGKELIQIGKQEGKIEGKIEGEQEALIWAWEAKFGTLDSETRLRIEQVKDVDKLKDLLLQVLKVDSIEQMKW